MNNITNKIIEYIHEGTLEDIKTLDFNKEDINNIVYSPYSPYTTPLVEASYAGRHEIVKYLIERGADVNLYDKKTPSPLETAISRNRVNIVETLLQAKANVDTLYSGCPYYYEGSSPLHIVSKNIEILTTYEDPTDYLRELDNANDNAWGRGIWEEYTDCIKIVKLLLQYGIDVNKDIRGLTALHWAANDIKNEEDEYVANEAFGLLLDAGANPYSGEHEHTPVYVVVSNGNIETIKKYFSKIDIEENLKKLLKVVKQSEHENKKELREALIITHKIYTLKKLKQNLNCAEGSKEEKKKIKMQITSKLNKLNKILFEL